MSKLTMVEALNLALAQEMDRDSNVVLMGEDIGVNGGVFRVTKDLQSQFGENRVLDTPLAECGIVGTAVGMAVYGLRPVVEIQFSGFTMQAFDQIEQNMARLHNRTQGKYTVPMVLRTPYGGNIRAVEHHSESREAYWAHTPGLHVVIPSGPRNARALLAAAIRSDEPVIFYEPKAIYRAFREEVPDAPELLEIGKANVVQEGSDITIISYGATLRTCIEAAQDLQEDHNVSADVIDLLSVSPIDTETIATSVQKTGRCLIVNEGQRTCGIASELIARINETCFEYLEAPIKRLTGFDTVFPYFQVEEHFLPECEEIVSTAKSIVAWE
ncbi:MAG: alpha-ketoacid dehydrogenase subunit beta [Phycisphaerae bacterium]|nr:alpha-ketoacid dehydrogenase subunit beta [Phycisphaerae bacterium]